MAKAASLQPLIDLMQDRVEDATRALGTLVAAEQDAKSKLQLLVQYREEYVARLRNASAQGIDLAVWRNYQAFIDRIDQAIAQQRATVAATELRTAEGQTEWLQQNKKKQIQKRKKRRKNNIQNRKSIKKAEKKRK